MLQHALIPSRLGAAPGQWPLHELAARSPPGLGAGACSSLAHAQLGHSGPATGQDRLGARQRLLHMCRFHVREVPVENEAEVFLNSVPLFSGLMREEKTLVVQALQEESFEQGEWIIRQARPLNLDLPACRLACPGRPSSPPSAARLSLAQEAGHRQQPPRACPTRCAVS